MFLNRRSELAALDERFRRDRAEFFVLYGRRRTGKSALLREFCRDKAHVYFLASQVREPDNLEQFRQALQAACNDPLLESIRFDTWDAALAYVTQLASGQRIVVILDEFPYLCQENPALPSILQRWWDLHGRSTRIFFVLCGSHLGFMERGVLAERSPLYGRRTGQARLAALLPWDAALFFPGYTTRDRLAAYGVLGGTPAYLERCSPEEDLRSNILREALHPNGFLFDEVSFLLRTELAQTATYMSILKAVAGGATRLTEIAGRAGLPATSASKYLGVLGDMELVRRDVPCTDAHAEKSKRGLYVVADPFVAFWCRFVLPHQSLIQAGQGQAVWDQFIEPGLDTYLGQVFEQVCRQYVLHRWSERHWGIPRRVGRWWGREGEMDLLAEVADGGRRVTLAGECKWWHAQVGRNVLEGLKVKARALPADWQREVRFALFSLSGFTPELQETARQEGVELVDGDALLAPSL